MEKGRAPETSGIPEIKRSLEPKGILELRKILGVRGPYR